MLYTLIYAVIWYFFKNELSCQRMKTEIYLICAGSAAHHLNRMHLLTVALLNMQHISPSSSLIQNSSKVHTVNSPYRAWLYHLQSRDEVIKCRLIFECSSTWKQLTKQNISYSCIMHIIQKHTLSLSPSLCHCPCHPTRRQWQWGLVSLDMEQSSAIDWHHELLFPRSFPTIPVIPLS